MTRTAGAHVKGRQLHLAFLEPPNCDGILASPACPGVRLEPNGGLPEAAQLVDLKDRVVAELRAAKVTRVVLVQTRKTNSWSYRDAYNRVIAVAALMFAAHELQFEFSTEKTSAISKYLEVNATELDAVDSGRFGYKSNPKYWTTGLAQAYAGAAYGLSQGGERK